MKESLVKLDGKSLMIKSFHSCAILVSSEGILIMTELLIPDLVRNLNLERKRLMMPKTRLLIVLLAIALISCATTSSKRLYLQTKLEFNQHVTTYLKEFEKVPPEVQKKWREEIDPQIALTDSVLNTWYTAIQLGSDSPEQLQDALDAKNALIDLIIKKTGGGK